MGLFRLQLQPGSGATGTLVPGSLESETPAPATVLCPVKVDPPVLLTQSRTPSHSFPEAFLHSRSESHQVDSQDPPPHCSQ